MIERRISIHDRPCDSQGKDDKKVHRNTNLRSWLPANWFFLLENIKKNLKITECIKFSMAIKLSRLADLILLEYKNGFRKERSCIEANNTIKLKLEKKVKFNEETPLCFIKYEKALRKLFKLSEREFQKSWSELLRSCTRERKYASASKWVSTSGSSWVSTNIEI